MTSEEKATFNGRVYCDGGHGFEFEDAQTPQIIGLKPVILDAGDVDADGDGRGRTGLQPEVLFISKDHVIVRIPWQLAIYDGKPRPLGAPDMFEFAGSRDRRPMAPALAKMYKHILGDA